MTRVTLDRPLSAQNVEVVNGWMKDVGIGSSAGRTYSYVEERNPRERINCCPTRQQTLSSSNDDFTTSTLVPSIPGIVAHGEFEELMTRTSRG